MARSYGGPNGGFSGKVGSVVGYRVGEQWYIRGTPRKSAKNKRGTAAQNRYRDRLRQLNRFLLPFLPIVQMGFKEEAETKHIHAFNQAKSYNLKHAFNEENQLDFSRVKLSSGKLPLPATIEAKWIDNGLLVTWSTEEVRNPYDQLMFGIHTNNSNSASDTHICFKRRMEGQEYILLDTEFRKFEMHVWVAFVDDQRQHCSDSRYLGPIFGPDFQEITS